MAISLTRTAQNRTTGRPQPPSRQTAKSSFLTMPRRRGFHERLQLPPRLSRRLAQRAHAGRCLPILPRGMARRARRPARERDGNLGSRGMKAKPLTKDQRRFIDALVETPTPKQRACARASVLARNAGAELLTAFPDLLRAEHALREALQVLETLKALPTTKGEDDACS